MKRKRFAVEQITVQHFSGMRYDEFLRKRLFEPLGMQDTSFGLPKEKLRRLTTVYGPKEPFANTYVIMDAVEKMVAVFMAQYQPFNLPLFSEFQTLVYESVVD